LRGFLLFAAVSAVSLAGAASAAGTDSRVLVATLDNDINPVSQDYLQDQVRRAETGGYDALVVELDTPGGLGTSMRNIVKTFLASPVAIVVYVSPAGSSADSAGAVIGQAADVLAMAPQTNIGSSTPITTNGADFSKDLRRKIVNDAAAYVSELAREHGRNAKAAEAMVRDAANYGAREAAARNVVDVVAPTLDALLNEIDGTVTTPKGLTLDTAGATVEYGSGTPNSSANTAATTRPRRRRTRAWSRPGAAASMAWRAQAFNGINSTVTVTYSAASSASGNHWPPSHSTSRHASTTR